MASIYKSEAGRQKIMAEYQNILAAWPVANKQYKTPTSQGETFIIESGYEKSIVEVKDITILAAWAQKAAG